MKTKSKHEGYNRLKEALRSDQAKRETKAICQYIDFDVSSEKDITVVNEGGKRLYSNREYEALGNGWWRML